MQKLVEAPEVKSVTLKSFSVQSKTIVFDVQMFNPNPFSLPIKGLSGDVQLNQFDVGHFQAKSHRSLGAQKTQTVTLPISIDPESFGRATSSVLQQRQALYRLMGTVDTSVGSVDFSHDGELSVQDILASLIPSFGL